MLQSTPDNIPTANKLLSSFDLLKYMVFVFQFKYQDIMRIIQNKAEVAIMWDFKVISLITIVLFESLELILLVDNGWVWMDQVHTVIREW